MALDRRSVLAAIAAETGDRGGPMPVWLVPVAANAKTKPERETVDSELLALRGEGLIDCHRQPNGTLVSLSDAGRAALRQMPAPKRQAAKAEPPAETPAETPPATEPAATPPMPDALGERQHKAPSPTAGPLPELEHVDPELQPRLYGLLMDLGKLALDQLHDAVDRRDLHQARRLNALAQQVMRHTRRSS